MDSGPWFKERVLLQLRSTLTASDPPHFLLPTMGLIEFSAPLLLSSGLLLWFAALTGGRTAFLLWTPSLKSKWWSEEPLGGDGGCQREQLAAHESSARTHARTHDAWIIESSQTPVQRWFSLNWDFKSNQSTAALLAQYNQNLLNFGFEFMWAWW